MYEGFSRKRLLDVDAGIIDNDLSTSERMMILLSGNTSSVKVHDLEGYRRRDKNAISLFDRSNGRIHLP